MNRYRHSIAFILASQLFSLPFGVASSHAASEPNPPVYAPPLPPEKKAPTVSRICQLIGANADAHGIPRDFFARLIWKESRFDHRAVSPVGAEGIAQFMPYTAKERGLADPFDVEQAIPASANFLRDLKGAFGNGALQPPPIMQEPGAFRTGCVQAGFCRSKRKTTFSILPARLPTILPPARRS